MDVLLFLGNLAKHTSRSTRQLGALPCIIYTVPALVSKEGSGGEEMRSREEKRISSQIPLNLLLIILLWIKLLPNRSREDMFISLVPSPIHHFRECRVIICAFQLCGVDWLFGGFGSIGGTEGGIICVEGGWLWSAGFGEWRRFGGVVEEETVIGSERVVDYEVVKIVML